MGPLTETSTLKGLPWLIFAQSCTIVLLHANINSGGGQVGRKMKKEDERGWKELGVQKVDACFVQLSRREEEQWDSDRSQEAVLQLGYDVIKTESLTFFLLPHTLCSLFLVLMMAKCSHKDQKT